MKLAQLREELISYDEEIDEGLRDIVNKVKDNAAGIAVAGAIAAGSGLLVHHHHGHPHVNIDGQNHCVVGQEKTNMSDKHLSPQAKIKTGADGKRYLTKSTWTGKVWDRKAELVGK